MVIPTSLISFFACIGLFTAVYCLTLGSKYLFHYAKFKTLPLSEEEEKIKFLREHIQQQNQKIKSLEKETEKMTLALLNQFSQ